MSSAYNQAVPDQHRVLDRHILPSVCDPQIQGILNIYSYYLQSSVQTYTVPLNDALRTGTAEKFFAYVAERIVLFSHTISRCFTLFHEQFVQQWNDLNLMAFMAPQLLDSLIRQTGSICLNTIYEASNALRSMSCFCWVSIKYAWNSWTTGTRSQVVYLCRDVINSKRNAICGLSFSFPCNQESLQSGSLTKWTKGFDLDGAIDNDPAMMLNSAFKAKASPVHQSLKPDVM